MHNDKNIILFDGVCNLCNTFINLLIDWDKKNAFYFVALQSETGQILLEKYHISKNLDTVFLLKNGRVFMKSSAALEVMTILGGFFKIFSFLKLFPLSFRDRLYDWVAKNRYKYLGKKDSCRVPTPELMAKFL